MLDARYDDLPSMQDVIIMVTPQQLDDELALCLRNEASWMPLGYLNLAIHLKDARLKHPSVIHKLTDLTRFCRARGWKVLTDRRVSIVHIPTEKELTK